MWYNGKELDTPKKKADAFVTEYEKVSRRKIPREAKMKKKVNEWLRQEQSLMEESGEITLQEVEEALRGMDGSKVAGPDGLHPRLLKELPEVAVKVVLQLFRLS